jgi:hypothetical protein
VIVATWFTYDVDGLPLWLTMAGNRAGANTFSGLFYRTTGPPFNSVSFNPGLVVANAAGSGTLTFSDANNGTFTYTVNGSSQVKAITRSVFGPLPTCTFGVAPDLALATNYQDLWWNAPGGSEAGWGINLTHQGDVIFAAWLTYDFDGSALWLSTTAPKTSPGVYAGTLYRTMGPRFNAAPFDSAKVTVTPVGSATFAFADGNHATFAYTVGGAAQAKAITRYVFVAPGTTCQ